MAECLSRRSVQEVSEKRLRYFLNFRPDPIPRTGALQRSSRLAKGVSRQDFKVEPGMGLKFIDL